MTLQRDENLIAENKVFDAIKNRENSNSNLSRSRVSSLSSFFSTSSVDQKSHSVFGFRKFAKTYLAGSGKSSKRSSSKLTDRLESSFTSRHSINRPTYVEGFFPARHQERKSYADFQRQLEKNELEVSAKIQKVAEGVVDYHLDIYGVPQKVPDLSKGESDSDSGVFMQFDDEVCEEKPLKDEQPSRSIVLANIPNNTGLGSILSQICGGPLESVLLCKNEAENLARRAELNFLTTEGARSFMKFGSTNLFKINGVHLVPCWANQPDAMVPALSAELFEEIPEVCRCLIMKKYATNTKRYKHGESSKDPPPDVLDMAEIRHDFGLFGTVQDIAPIVSRKLCISVSFYSVHSAIRAMNDYEDPTSVFYKKYFKNWAVWYGKDITDRPCFEL